LTPKSSNTGFGVALFEEAVNVFSKFDSTKLVFGLIDVIAV
jgi:hypothetical protein